MIKYLLKTDLDTALQDYIIKMDLIMSAADITLLSPPPPTS